MFVDLNSDLGESFGSWKMGNDDQILPVVTSANIACGFHAGDPLGILKTLRKAVELNCHDWRACILSRPRRFWSP